MDRKEYLKKWKRDNREKVRKHNKEWKERNPEKVRASKRLWRSRHSTHNNYYKYGVTEEWYQAKLKDQGQCCAICGTKDSGTRRGFQFHIDHCHKTGQLRGLLCYRCNIFLAHLEHDPSRYTKAVNYLEQYSTGSTPASSG